MIRADRDVIARIARLIAACDAGQPMALSARTPGLSIRFEKHPGCGARVAVRSPDLAIPGVLRLRAPDPGFEVAQRGQSVQLGQILGFVQYGPAFVPLRAPADGQLSGATAQDGAPVWPGSTVFWIVRGQPPDQCRPQRQGAGS